jgi:AraC family transcriptional regulator
VSLVNYLAQVQRGIDYIEAHLDAEVQPGEVARHAGISQWHFQRIFKALTSETLKAYIRSRRLANSLERLATSDERVLEIALGAGFESQESFTRAFKKAFGMTPAAYRRHGRRFAFPRKVRIDEDYLRHLHGGLSLEPELAWQPERLLAGLDTRFYSVDSEKNNLGDKLPPLWNTFLARLPEIANAVPGMCYGVVRQTQAKTDELEYTAAIAVDREAPLPPGMIHVRVPAARYARFAHRGAAARIDHTVNYIYSSWLASSRLRHTYGADLELYDARYHPTSEDSLMHYAIPVEDAADER